MGLLDSIVGALGQGQGGGGGGNAALLNMVVGMLANSGGGGAAGAGGSGNGLGALVEQFTKGGLGDVVGSWVSTGQNLPVSPEQLGSVLGGDKIAGMASQLGMNQGDLLGQLSQMLPQVVDKLTPQGQVPQGGLGDLDGLMSGLGSLLKR
jgi:uncharacterized protein YidB (DUF937 family)